MSDRPSQTHQLHVLLGAGSAMAVLAFTLLTYLGIAPLLPQGDSDTTLIAYVLSAASVVAALVALFFFKSRIPTRVLGQTEAELWSTAPMPQPALLLWFLLDGATVVAAVGFLLTGHLMPATLMLLWLFIYWLQRPASLTKG